MEFEVIIGNAISILFFVPIIIIVNLIGRAIIIHKFGGKIGKIYIGNGKKLIELSKFFILNRFYFNGALVEIDAKDLKISNKTFMIMQFFVGYLLNIVIASALWILLEFHIIPFHFLYPYFIFYSFLIIVFPNFIRTKSESN